MTKWEYIRARVDFGDLQQLNNLGSTGWEVCASVTSGSNSFDAWVLLKRPLEEQARSLDEIRRSLNHELALAGYLEPEA